MRKINKEFAEVMMTKPEGRMIEQLTVSKPQAHDRPTSPLSRHRHMYMYMFTVYYNPV